MIGFKFYMVDIICFECDKNSLQDFSLKVLLIPIYFSHMFYKLLHSWYSVIQNIMDSLESEIEWIEIVFIKLFSIFIKIKFLKCYQKGKSVFFNKYKCIPAIFLCSPVNSTPKQLSNNCELYIRNHPNLPIQLFTNFPQFPQHYFWEIPKLTSSQKCSS